MQQFEDKLRKKTKYNVLVTDGNKLGVFPVIEVVGYNEGFAMRYKNSSKKLDVVYMSRNYRPLEKDGEFFIGKRAGNNSACVIDFENEKVKVACEVIGPSTDPDCPGEDLSAIIRTDGLAIGYKSLYESKIPWKMILILVGIAIAVMAIIYFIKMRGG